MPGKQKDKVVRIEQVKSGDKVLYTKEIVEPSVTESNRGLIWSMEPKDFIGLLIQAIGLLTLLFAWLSYTSDEKDKNFEKASKIQQEYRDSLSALGRRKEKVYKDYKDSLQLMFANNLDRNELFIKQQELLQKMKHDDYIQEMERRSYDQRNNLFQKQLLNSINESDKNRQEERNIFHAQTQLDIYMQAAAILSDLKESLGIGELDKKSLTLLQVVMNKIKLLKQDTLHILLSEFQKEYEFACKAIRVKRSMNIANAIAERLLLNSCKQTDNIIRMQDVRRDTAELKEVQTGIKTIQKEFEPFVGNRDYQSCFSSFIQSFGGTVHINSPLTDQRKLTQQAFINVPDELTAKAEDLYNIHRMNMDGTKYGKKKKGIFRNGSTYFLPFRDKQIQLCKDLDLYKSKLIPAIIASAVELENSINATLTGLENKSALIHKKMNESNLLLNN